MNKNENAIFESFEKLSKNISKLDSRPGSHCPIYLEGGAALFMNNIKPTYKDIDWYVPDRWLKTNEIPQVRNANEDVLNNSLRDGFRFNPTYKPTVGKTAEFNGIRFELQYINPAMVYLMKLDAGREKDLKDMETISTHTTPEEIIGAINSCIEINNREIAINMASQTLSEITCHYLLDSKNYKKDIANLISMLDFDQGTKEDIGRSFGINISRDYKPQEDLWRGTQKNMNKRPSNDLTM